tara:strand:- start:1753 stop:2511 length:759 start_codon:yes stop_codon:yes gene_type:complete
LIISKKLSKFKEIKHGFFNRAGGKSNGIYKSLNCGPGSKDKKKNVIKNLNIVKKRICKNSKQIYLLHQIHSNKFIFLNNYSQNTKKFKADAIITNVAKLPIAILTADCAPILLYDKHKNMIAAIHAGWRGAFKGIVSKVINFMVKKGCKKNHIIAAIGPCISQKSYNVREDFKKKFLKKNKKNLIFFKKRKDALYFDLSSYIKFQLKSMNISKIDMINIDTFDKKNNFFSARRSLNSNLDDYGRNISLIMIN